MKDLKQVQEILKKYGFNPLVTTNKGINEVDLKISAKINKENLEYLKQLNKNSPTES